MTYLVSTAQRCGSTWLVRMLAGMAGSREVYVDGLELGFSLAKSRETRAVKNLVQRLRREAGLMGTTTFRDGGGFGITLNR